MASILFAPFTVPSSIKAYKRAADRLEAQRIEQEQAAIARIESHLQERKCPLHTSDYSNIRDHQVESHQREKEKEQMLMNGWCPHQVHHLLETYNLKTLSYFVTLTRHSYRNVNHAGCYNSPACITFNTDQSTYKTRHTLEGCTCSIVLTPYRELISIIRKGEIPLISIKDCGNSISSKYELRLQPRSGTAKYVAISHVWADGLGNPNENGLPLCQIKQLKNILTALHEISGDNPLFWMDTLCIPVGKHEHQLRLTQIDKMASVYKGATCSLVLDIELMATRLDTDLLHSREREGDENVNIEQPTNQRLEARARIACSVWMTRSWTYQEGELPFRIAFQFQNSAFVLGRFSTKDGTYKEQLAAPESAEDHFEALIPKPRGSAEDIELEVLPRPSGESHNSLPLPSGCECVDIDLQRTLYTIFFKEANEFATVWNELTGRSTTMPRDVPLIVSNVLDLDNRDLLTYHDSGDMFQAIMISQESLPLSIFFNFGPRQDSKGNHQNRWVPSQVGADVLTFDKSLEVYSSYLLYKYVSRQDESKFSVYTIEAVLPRGSEVHLHFESGGNVYAVERPDLNADQLDTTKFHSTCVIIENTTSKRDLGVKRGACFLFQNNDDTLTFDCPIRIRHVRNPTKAQDHIYALIAVGHKRDFKINYDPIPNFKRLTRRKAPHLDRGLWRSKTVQIVLSCGFWIAFGTSIYAGKPILEAQGEPLGTSWILWVFCSIGLFIVSGPLRVQRYIRSFEEIAKKHEVV